MRVMQSFPAVRDTTNPYLRQLVTALDSHAEVRTFSWRGALAGGFDVMHVHWPELLIRSPSTIKTWCRRIALVGVLLRIRIGRRALVRTLHNASPHEPGTWFERRLLALVDRSTTLFIALVPSTIPPVAGPPMVVIPHGDYRSWFAGRIVPPAMPGHFGCVGLVRRYKGIDALIRAFGLVEDRELRLRIVGRAQDQDLAADIARAAAVDPRISARLEYVSDDDMATEVGLSSLVVLPYRQLENSGAALLALSLRRPILVPGNDITRALAAEVGPGWVFTFDGELTPQTLRDAARAAQDFRGRAEPDLTGRAWPTIGGQHLQAYRRALEIRAA